MIAPALLGVVAALAPTGGSTRLELAAAATLERKNLWDTMQKDPPRGDAFGGGATLGATLFFRRVVDDDAAPSLQSFLQRASSACVEAGGGETSTNFPFYSLNTIEPSAFMSRYGTVDDHAHAAASGDGYIGRIAYVAARLDLDYARWQEGYAIGGFGNVTPISPIPNADSSELALDASIAGGVRWRELVVFAGWSVTPYRVGADAFAVRFWGGAFAGARTVLRRRWDLAARIDVLDGGARLDASATLWLRRRFGLTLGVEGGHGAFFDSAMTFDRAGGRVAVAWWLTPRFAATVAYAPAWQATTPVAGFGEAVRELSYVAHVVTLTLTSRPPLSRR